MTPANRAIAVVGEALVDVVLESDGATTPHLGGGAFNAARTLGRLGLAPVYIGRLSRDRSGRALRAALEQAGVALDGVVMTDKPTTFARVEIDPAGVANYRFYIDGTASAGLLPDEARAGMPTLPAGLHVGGLGFTVEPQAGTTAGLVREAGPATLVLVDPNCRRDAVSDPAAYRALLHEVMARADIVKASDEDLAYLAPDQPPLQAARGLLRAGPSVVLITHGGRGATVLTVDHEASVSAPAVDVVDTIGAGDAFGAAWLGAWVAEGLGRSALADLEALVRTTEFAVVVAARTCERAGAEPPAAAEVGAEWCFAPAPQPTAAIRGDGGCSGR